MFKFLFLENIFTYLYMPNNSVRRKRQKGGFVPTGKALREALERRRMIARIQEEERLDNLFSGPPTDALSPQGSDDSVQEEDFSDFNLLPCPAARIIASSLMFSSNSDEYFFTCVCISFILIFYCFLFISFVRF